MSGTSIISSARPLFRIYRADRAAIWFCTDHACRFDPNEGGACYTSTSPVGAFIEKFGRIRLLTDSLVAQYRMAVLYPTSDLMVLDLTDPRNLGLRGLTAEVHATLDYRQSQAVADMALSHGFGGILYPARHDLSSRLECVALLAEKAEAAPDYEHGLIFLEGTMPIPSYVRDEAQDRFAINIAPDIPPILQNDRWESDDVDWNLPDP